MTKQQQSLLSCSPNMPTFPLHVDDHQATVLPKQSTTAARETYVGLRSGGAWTGIVFLHSPMMPNIVQNRRKSSLPFPLCRLAFLPCKQEPSLHGYTFPFLRLLRPPRRRSGRFPLFVLPPAPEQQTNHHPTATPTKKKSGKAPPLTTPPPSRGVFLTFYYSILLVLEECEEGPFSAHSEDKGFPPPPSFPKSP